MTYRNCRKLIDNKVKAGSLDPTWATDMLDKLDVFLLADRITDVEYQELAGMINANLSAETK